MSQDHHPKILNKPFEPLLEGLNRPGQGNPEVAQPAARILDLYSTMWGAYSAKKAHNQRLERENKALRASNIDLCHTLQFLERRYTNQEGLLAYFEQAFENVRDGILGIFKDWERCSPGPVPE